MFSIPLIQDELMGLNFTSGEVINFLMVGTMVLTLIYTRRRHSVEDSNEDRQILNAHLIDCAKKNGSVETKLQTLETGMDRMERKVDNVGAQVRAIATGTDSEFIILRRPSGKDGVP